MNIVIWIVIGGIAGLFASIVMKSESDLIEDIILGMAGGFVGGFIMNAFGAIGITGISMYSMMVSIAGAIVLISLGRLLHR